MGWVWDRYGIGMGQVWDGYGTGKGWDRELDNKTVVFLIGAQSPILCRHDTGTSETQAQTGCTVEFKQRHKQHKESFEDPEVNQTCLSQHIWKKLKASNPHIPYSIVWSEVGRAPPYNPSTGVCKLCLLEKYHIMNNPDGASLNQRSEFFSHCYHKYPQLLKNFNFNLPNHKKTQKVQQISFQ